MDLFDDKNIDRLDKDREKLKDFEDGKLNIHVLSTRDPTTSYDSLLHIKYLFQRMLPKMPRDYILRQVFDDHHFCMTLNEAIENKPDTYRIIGAVLFRPCFERKLVEIVFLAVDSEYHISGYGTFLFNCFKEICKIKYSTFLSKGTSSINTNIFITDLSVFDSEIADKPNDNENISLSNNQATFTSLYLLTYADNSAIGFFKKQGFSLRPRSSEWIGYIKDYEGGTLMECKIHKGINYLHRKAIIKRLRDKIFTKMSEINEFHILRSRRDMEEFKKDVGETASIETLGAKNRREVLSNFLYFLVCSLQSHPSSWPFLEPVSAKDVPDYFEVISNPIDMSLIMERLKSEQYQTLNQFSYDVYLMCSNCFTYNPPETQYYKCAENIKKYYESLIEKYAGTISWWETRLE